MNPVTPSQDYRRKAQQQQNASYVPASYGAASQYSRNNVNYHTKSKGSSKGAKIVVAIIFIALIATVAGLGYYVFKQSQKDAVNADLHKLDDAEMEALDSALTGSTTFDEPFTVLLLGSDARVDDESMGARTDTNIIVRVDPFTNTITMMSIPRDTAVDLPGVGMAKAATNLTGIPIDHYAEINFEGLVDLINAIGGIDVYVDERIEDPDAGDYIIEEGEQHLSGEEALVFARSRAYADGDYTRQRNQRKVIDAIIHKGLEAPATDLDPGIDEVPHDRLGDGLRLHLLACRADSPQQRLPGHDLLGEHPVLS